MRDAGRTLQEALGSSNHRPRLRRGRTTPRGPTRLQSQKANRPALARWAVQKSQKSAQMIQSNSRADCKISDALNAVFSGLPAPIPIQLVDPNENIVPIS